LIKRIFVAVGTHPQPFIRLFEEIDKIAGKHKEWIFFAQTGTTDFKSKKFKCVKFLEGNNYEKHFKSSDLIIGHPGAGTIIDALKSRKPLIVVPRRKKFNEHTDDHQLDLGKAIQERKMGLMVFEMKDLEKTIVKVLKQKASNFKSEKESIIKEIEDYLNKL